jgi:hypothetical protein
VNTEEIVGTLWVCTDCLLARESDGTESPDREPWGEIPEDHTVTCGLLWSEHADDCENRAADEWVTECDCERISFSWHACPACGSTLGGERHAYALWAPVRAETLEVPA